MNICFYCDTIFSFGGVQRVLAVIAKALSAHHDVTILTLDAPAQEDLTMYELNESTVRFEYLTPVPLNVIEYLPCKTYSFLYKKILPHTRMTSRGYGFSSFPPSQRKALITQLNDGAYDVVVGVHVFLSLKLASVRSELRARRVVGWMHNSYQAFFEHQHSYLGGRLKNHFAHQMQRLDDVIVLTHTDASLYSEQLHLHPSVIYNPLTLVPQGRSQSEAKKFLSVGRMSPYHKGFDILIEGFALFARQNSDWTLDIVGEGPEEKMLRGLIAKHGLEERIKIYPFTKEIQKHYASASAFVLSSRWEGFPLVLGEAMSHGLPLVASDIPVVRELLSDKKNGFVFSTGSASALAHTLLTCATSSSLQEMGQVSLRESESMQLGPIIQRWEEVLSLTPAR